VTSVDPKSPDEPLVIIGPVRTLDPNRPLAAAFATARGRVLAVGDPEEVRAAAPGAAELRHTGLVTPGLVDSHLHLQRAGLRALRHLPGDADTGAFLEMCRLTADDDDDWLPGLDPTVAERRAGLARVQRHLAALGLTSVVDPAVTLAEWSGYRAAHARGELGIRVVAMPWVPIEDGDEAAVERVLAGLDAFGGVTGDGDDLLRLGGTKLYVDGEGMRGEALLEEPWPHSGMLGVQRLRTLDLRELIVEAARRGWGAGCHAVGGGAVAIALDAFQAAADAGIDLAALRPQLIHAYLEPSGASRARAARLGVIASLQPSILYRNAEGLAERLGDRARAANPVRSWLDEGAVVALGSDGPYFPLDPRLILDQAVARVTADRPDGGFGIEEAVEADVALAASALGGAYTMFADDRRGRIRVGMQADWVLWDADPVAHPGHARELTVLRTVVDGRELHSLESDLVERYPAGSAV
jgi:predicted amidohydrolase YtcJ